MNSRLATAMICNYNEGMRTLKQDGIRKVFEGLTNFTQVRRVCIV